MHPTHACARWIKVKGLDSSSSSKCNIFDDDDRWSTQALTSCQKKNVNALRCLCALLSSRFHWCAPDYHKPYGGSGRCLVGGRRDAVSCSRDCVALSIRVVKRGCQLTLVSVLPSTLLAALSLWGLVTDTMLLFWPQLTWGKGTVVRYTPQVRDDFYATIMI